MGTPRVRQRPWELNQRVAMGAIELGWRRDPVGKSETGWAAARGQGGRTTCDKEVQAVMVSQRPRRLTEP